LGFFWVSFFGWVFYCQPWPQEARHERSAQLQKSADKYHKLAILHDELKEELREERAKVALGLKEMDQLQKENQLFSPALGKVLSLFFAFL
jgi:hypothetical protein